MDLAKLFSRPLRAALIYVLLLPGACGNTEVPVPSSSTFRVLERAESTTALSEYSKPVIHLIGETHLGKSQETVARVACGLLSDYEIDAVMLEQPDHLKFDWSPFARLEAQSQGAIAALQHEMLKDAEEMKLVEFGKYEPYLRKLQNRVPPNEVQKEIISKHGERGLNEFLDLLKGLEPQAKQYKRYEEGRFVSAADYLYVMLNLQGVDLPFHNVDSEELRSKFKLEKLPDAQDPARVNASLNARDNHTSALVQSLIQKNGYRQVVLISGALHRENLVNKLTGRGLAVNVAYDSMKNRLKRTIATLDNPQYVVGLAEKGASVGHPVKSAYLVDKEPSRQLLGRLNQLLGQFRGDLSSDQVTHVRTEFLQYYRGNRTRAKPGWSILTSTREGHTVRFSKSARENLVKVSVDRAISPKFVAGKDTPRGEFVISAVDPQQGAEPLYQGNNLEELLRSVNARLKDGGSSSVYLECGDMQAHKVDALATSLEIQKLTKGYNNLRIRPYERSGSDAFFSRGVKVEQTEETVQIEKLTAGERQGWFKATIRLSRGVLEVFARAKEVLVAFVRRLFRSLKAPGFQSRTLAGTVQDAYWSVRKQNGIEDDSLFFSFIDELGKTHIGRAIRSVKRAILNGSIDERPVRHSA